jgi:hypothetical protein
MIPLVDEPVVQLYFNAATNTYRARTNVGLNVKVNITAEPAPRNPDLAKYQGLPYAAEVS